MKELNVAFDKHSWVLTVTYNDGTTEAFTCGGDMSLAAAVAEVKKTVALKEKASAPSSERLVNVGPAAIAALEKKLRPGG